MERLRQIEVIEIYVAFCSKFAGEDVLVNKTVRPHSAVAISLISGQRHLEGACEVRRQPRRMNYAGSAIRPEGGSSVDRQTFAAMPGDRRDDNLPILIVGLQASCCDCRTPVYDPSVTRRE